MTNLTELQNLVDRFHANIDFYKDARNAYNEHSCRIEYIDPLLKLLGWDVANEKGLAPQYREVIAENYSTRTDRPDYTITLRGVPKFFVEAKKACGRYYQRCRSSYSDQKVRLERKASSGCSHKF